MKNKINEKEIKSKFVEMCRYIKLHNGKFVCLYSNMEYDERFTKIFEDKDFNILKGKMENLLFIINKDNSLINKDVETELWNLI